MSIMGSMQRLEVRQGQTLAMTPQLAQAIKLLQLSHLDLAAYVEAVCERNPLLVQPESSPAELAAGGAEADLHPVLVPPTASPYGKRSAGMQGFDARSLPPPDAAMPVALSDHLERQMELAPGDPRDRVILRHLIHCLDEAGYLREPLAEIALRLGVAEAHAAHALTMLQSFDPPGVGARDLAECLALQLKEKNRLDPVMQMLLTRLDWIARRDLPALRRLCGVDDEDLIDMLAEIRALEPRPGHAFSPPAPSFWVPDVLVRSASDGGWIVELNPETLPRILIDRVYYHHLSRTARRDGERDFLSACFQEAGWLKRSLDQRAETILKVATAIVKHQDGFFRHGAAHLRPLTLKAVAEAIGMHESTVSRVTANKALGTERGVFEMKFFFSAALSGVETHSAEAVRHRIRQLVDGEPVHSVLSDDAIAEKLKREGMNVARRTVAKYRDALRIPSSADRRRVKRIQGLEPARQDLY